MLRRSDALSWYTDRADASGKGAARMIVAVPVAPGELIGDKYRVERVIGRGGMGVVVAATHLELDEPVAIKFLLAGSQEHDSARFVREARAAAKIKSEHVCRVHDVGRLPTGEPFIVMEYLEGVDLARVLYVAGPQSPASLATWVIEACDALAEAHAAKIVHRDLKPANIFLAQRGHGATCTKVLDFGVSKLPAVDPVTGPKSLLGTPRYMSPEQIRSANDVDARSDIWSLGVILYEMACGQPPFSAASELLLAQEICDVDPPPLERQAPGIPRPFARIVEKCLAKKPEARFANVGELAAELLAFAPDLELLARRIVRRTQPETPAALVETMRKNASERPPAFDVLPALPRGSVPPPSNDRIFVGRVAELDAARSTVDRAARGKPGFLLFAGEAGIGKTAVLESVAAVASEHGAKVAWGRAWEAGGAPAYWPWIQVFRALGVREDLFAADAEGTTADALQLRFRQFDRAATRLKQAAEERLLTIVLDDLHTADVPSLLLLQFLARNMDGTRIVIVGSYRDAEARRDPEVGALIAKIVRDAKLTTLRRLALEDVMMWMHAVHDAPVDPRAAAQVHRVSEGNAFFVHELLRIGDAPTGSNLPDSLRAAVDDHLARVSDDVRAIIEAASVLGRDVDPRAVAHVADASLVATEEALREARDAEILTPLAGGTRLGFTHILLRERLYNALAPARRAALHARAAERALGGAGDIATAAHHFLEGHTCTGAVRAAEVARDAARAASRRLAFEEAGRLCARALAIVEDVGAEADALVCELETLLGESRLRAGDAAAGAEACLRAAARAKAAGRPEQLAEAALTYGIQITTGSVDPRMVELLTDALKALPEIDSPLRARLLARHAAALVPPRSDDETPFIVTQAREAVAMARRCGDRETILYVLQFAISGCSFLATSEERYGYFKQLMSLAADLDRPLVLLNRGGWWFSTLRENGRIEEAEATITAYERVLASFPFSSHRWVLPLMRAQSALFDGDLVAAERHGDDALALAEEAGTKMPIIHWAMHRLGIAHALGNPSRIAGDAERMMQIFDQTPGYEHFAGWLYAAFGRDEQALARIETTLARPVHFPATLAIAEAITFLRDEALAARVYPVLKGFVDVHAGFTSSHGALYIGPTARACADLAVLLGRHDEARALYTEALRVAERMKGQPFIELANKRLADLDRGS